MFGIFGGGIPTAQSLLNPFNIAGVPLNNNIYNPYSYVAPQPVKPATTVPTVAAPADTYYADYRKLITPPPMKVNTAGVGGINIPAYTPPKVTQPVAPTVNQYNWAVPTAPTVPAAKTAVPLLVKK